MLFIFIPAMILVLISVLVYFRINKVHNDSFDYTEEEHKFFRGGEDYWN